MLRVKCPDCGSGQLEPPDEDGWQYCPNCGSDFSPDYVPGDDDDREKRDLPYVKFGQEGSQVYLYGGQEEQDGAHVIVCSGCKFFREDPDDPYSSPGRDFCSKASLLAHLDLHREFGHVVPQSAIDRIKADNWI